MDMDKCELYRDAISRKLNECGSDFFYFTRKSAEEILEIINSVIDNEAEWIVLTDCYNKGIYCSKCGKKVFKKNTMYANQKVLSKYCPNCGRKMSFCGKKL